MVGTIKGSELLTPLAIRISRDSIVHPTVTLQFSLLISGDSIVHPTVTHNPTNSQP